MTLAIKLQNNNDVVASGEQPDQVLVFEGNWYFSPETVNQQYLQVTEDIYTCSYKGQCYWMDLKTPDIHIPHFAWVYRQPRAGYEFIKDKIGFYARDSKATRAIMEK